MVLLCRLGVEGNFLGMGVIIACDILSVMTSCRTDRNIGQQHSDFQAHTIEFCPKTRTSPCDSLANDIISMWHCHIGDVMTDNTVAAGWWRTRAH